MGKRAIAWLAVVVLSLIFSQTAFADPLWKMDKELTINALSVSEDGQRISAGTQDATAVVVDPSGKEISSFAAKNVVTGVSLLKDGQLLVSSDDFHVYSLDAQGKTVWDKSFPKMVKRLSASPDGSTIAISLYRANAVTLLDRQGNISKEIPVGIEIKALRVSPNGQWIAAAGADQYAYLFDASGKAKAKVPLPGDIADISVSDDGAWAAGLMNNKALIYGADGSKTGELATKDVVTSVDLSRDGAYIAVSDYSGNFYVGNADGRILWTHREAGAGQQIRLGAESKQLYAATDKGALFHYEMESLLASGRKAAQRQETIRITAIVAVAAALLFLAYWAWRRKPQTLLRIWKDKYTYLMLVPSFTLIFLFLYYPSISGLFHSLYHWNPGGRSVYVGLENFKRMVHDPYVSKGGWNLLILIVTGLIKTIVPPLLVAELIYHLKSKKSQYWFRTAFVVSVVIPTVGVLLVWQDLYDAQLGLINQILRAVGLGSFAHAWLGDTSTALWAVIFIGFPFVGILQLLVLYSGLIGISEEIIEAARMDGAKTFRIIRSIHLPLLAGQFKLLIVLAMIHIIQDFGGILIVTGGGPSDSTYVPALQMYYAATKFNDLGYASALGVAMFAIILVITVINMKFMKSAEE
ncbi:ABC transporter permease subunit [Cohnella candidum]|uniref:ABC transporter permease subunit n=1 Tax=Cohnella candidum TaxID=2674991 RepID=A0A3G3JXD1_9BACL|nr:ABC transporter permease subunit [Cohnella candidum]AYQ72910.1 ABC transporter permease subunit [Cohnella candidum]